MVSSFESHQYTRLTARPERRPGAGFSPGLRCTERWVFALSDPPLPRQGFTYVAPSILEEMARPLSFRARSPRKHARGLAATFGSQTPSPLTFGTAPESDAPELMDTTSSGHGHPPVPPQQIPQPKWVWQPH